MYLNWQARLSAQPELLNLDKWPQIISTDVPEKKRKKFLLNQKIVARVLNQEPTLKICSELKISKSKVSKALTRCLAGDENEEPALTRGMIPGLKIKCPKRKSELSTLVATRGATCAFQHLLDTVDGLKLYLDKVLKSHLHDKPNSQQLKFQGFFSSFVNYLKIHNWPADTYPFTEISVGKESLRRYMNKRIIELKNSNLLKSSFERDLLSILVKQAFSEIQIDEHTYDAASSIEIEFNGTRILLRVSRISLILATDVATSTRLSYVVVLNRAPNHYDFLECLARIYKPWKQMQLLTPGIGYDLNSAFPPGTLFQLDNAPMIGEISLDNAKIHHAKNVRSFIVNKMGGSFHTGIPGQPEDRNWIEYAFKLVAKDAHRFRSTTGSNPNDPIKESLKNSKEPPVVNLRTLEETIEVTLAAENARERPYLGSLSPLKMMELHLKQHYIPRYSREQNLEIQNRFITKNNIPIKYSKKDNKSPYINFHYVKYKGICLAKNELIGKRITITYDPNDIRTVNAYLDGKLLGILYAPKKWRSFPHSMRTRALVHKLVRENQIKHSDPLVGYFDLNLNNKNKPKAALELIRICREFTPTHFDTTNTVMTIGDPLMGAQLSNIEDDYTNFKDEDLDFPEWTPELSGLEEGGIQNGR